MNDTPWERISGFRDQDGDAEWRLHMSRYLYASAFVRDGDTIVDAACGTGYAAPLFRGIYCGVDRVRAKSDDQRFIAADLTTWVPDFSYDVWVGLETIEHLSNLHAYLQAAKRARRWMIISTPIIPTKHFNPHHVRDLSEPEVIALFTDAYWELFDVFHQQGGVYGLFAFERVQR